MPLVADVVLPEQAHGGPQRRSLPPYQLGQGTVLFGQGRDDFGVEEAGGDAYQVVAVEGDEPELSDHRPTKSAEEEQR